MSNQLSFASDYMVGAHPSILQRLQDTNLIKHVGYGLDECCEAAKAKIRRVCNAPEADVYFLVGGTQTNATVISALLKSYQGVVCADSGHIAVHEAGAIEYGGHKVLPLPHTDGKISAEQIETRVNEYLTDTTCDHTVMPGMVYISQPTEYGTLYNRAELASIAEVCRKHRMPLYVDGARLAYALACPENDVTLADLAELCDAFYIGGTKCGSLFGEALVMKHGLIPHFFTIVKQHGALLAKGWLAGLQFDALFTDDLYLNIGKPAINAADDLRDVLTHHHLPLLFGSPTNQIFCVIENGCLEKLIKKVDVSIFGRCDDAHSIIRFVTSWATRPEEIAELDKVLQEI